MENKKTIIEKKSSYESLGEEYPAFEETAEYDELEHIILEKLKRVFWDKLQDEIREKNYEGLFAVLNEIKERICQLIPNRSDLHNNVNENIDTKLIEQMLKHDALDYSYIFNVIQFIITQLKILDSVRDEPMYEIWREQTNRKITSNDPRLHIVLPIFLRESLHRIDKIAFEISAFKQSSLYNINVEKHPNTD